MFLNMKYEQITVKALCEKSMINRRTFQLHYDTIDDLLADVLDEMSIEFIKYTDDYDHFANVERIVKDFLNLPIIILYMKN